MNSKIETKFNSAKNLEIFPQINSKRKTIDLIKEYLSSQPEKIKNLQNISKIYYKVINDFIEISQNYSSEIEKLALEIIPDYTIEGQIAQALQGILLFFSEGLNNLIKNIKNEKINEKGEEFNNILNQFNIYNQSYYQKIKESILNSEKYKKEIEKYEEFLINEQYQQHIKKGNLKTNQDEIINDNENANKGQKLLNEKHNQKEKINLFSSFKDNDNTDINEENYVLNDENNEEEVIKKQKLISSSVNQSNEILNNIKDYLSKEIIDIRKKLFNICNNLIEELLKYANFQKKNFDIQKGVISNLSKAIKSEEKDQNTLKQSKIKLKYLEIYRNIIQEKNELIINDKPNFEEKNHSNKEIKKITKYESNIPIKNDNFSNEKIKLNSIIKNINNCNNIKNKEEDQKISKLKNMIKKLSRSDIIIIFEKIKSLNINIVESDFNLIEQEMNINLIHELLLFMFYKTEKYTEKEKKFLLNLFEKDRVYILYFIRVLNDHRTKGIFDLSEKTIKYLGELFKYLNNLFLIQNDIELFKFIFILSMTYYYFSKDQNQKIYLFSYIKDHPYYQNIDFWDNYLNELVDHDLKGYMNIYNLDLENKEINKLKKEEKEKLNNCFFSNFLTIVKAMADFRIDKKLVRNFIERNKDKYILSREQFENICMVYDISLNENELNYKGDYLQKDDIEPEENTDIIKFENEKKESKIEINLEKSEILKKNEKDLIKKENINECKDEKNNENKNIETKIDKSKKENIIKLENKNFDQENSLIKRINE